MFRYILKKLNYIHMKSKVINDNKKGNIPAEDISINLNDNINRLKEIFGVSGDIIYRDFFFGSKEKIKAAVIFLDGMSERAVVNEIIMKPLMYEGRLYCDEELTKVNIDNIKNNFLSVGDVKKVKSIVQIVDGCLSGDTIFLIEGCSEALVIHSRAWETRGVEEPKTESVVRGPREGFAESINTNMSLIRRKIKSPYLTFETMIIGTQTRTPISIAYLRGVVNPKLIEEVKERLNRIDTDAILESGYIEQFIEDAPLSIFPTIGNSEKPDTAAAKILEGRVAILVDGTPFVLTLPMLFVEGFQNSEDYYSRTYFASFIRLLRFFCFFISVLAPTIYVVLTTFHQELIPTKLLFTLANNREGIPFPGAIEAFLMIITLEILREAGVRLPRPVGQAVSIVGALVLGEAAVSAGLVGPLMVITISLTALSSFVVAVYTDVTSILRMFFLILGSVLGIFGVAVGELVVLIHLASLRSFGSPYLSPFAPLTTRDLKDTFMRVPMWAMHTRPRTIGWHNIKREEEGLKPHPPKNNSEQ